VKLWDAHTGAELFTLKGHSDRVMAVAYTPDGERLISAGDDRQLKVWDARNGTPLLAVPGCADKVAALAFSPDGWRLGATTSTEGAVKVWDAEPGREERAPDADERERRRAETAGDPGWHEAELARLGKDAPWPATVFHLNRLLAARPSDSDLLSRRAAVVAAAAKTGDADALGAHARTALAAGQLDEYRKAAAALAGAAKDDRLIRLAAAVCVLAPDAVSDFRPLLAAHEKALGGAKRPAEDLRLHGGLLLRAGRPEEAAKRLLEAKKDRDETPYEDLLLALAYHRLKRADEAARCLARAVAALDGPRRGLEAADAVAGGAASPLHALAGLRLPTGPDWRERQLGWEGWLDLQILRREAEAALKP
jgi:hypothetical protein